MLGVIIGKVLEDIDCKHWSNRQMLKTLTVALFAFVCLAICAGEADGTYEKAMASLRDAEADHAKLVPAIKLLIEAEQGYEKAGDDVKAALTNSAIYWARKRMTVADLPTIEITKKIETVMKAIPVSQAGSMLVKAEEFAKKNPNNHLEIAIVYFEIADRFPDDVSGRAAMKLSLSAMSKIQSNSTAAQTPSTGKVVSKIFSSNLPSVPFKDGENFYSNRKYVVKNVPEKYIGWAMLQVKAGVGVNKIKLAQPATVLFVYHEDSKVPEGFELTEDTVTVMNPSATSRLIYSKKCQGEISFPPGAYFLVVESKP